MIPLLAIIITALLITTGSAQTCWKAANKDAERLYAEGQEYYYCVGDVKGYVEPHAWIEVWEGKGFKIIDANLTLPDRFYTTKKSYLNGTAKEVKGGMIYQKRRTPCINLISTD